MSVRPWCVIMQNLTQGMKAVVPTLCQPNSIGFCKAFVNWMCRLQMLSWTCIFVNLLLAMLCQPKLRLQQSLCGFGWQSIAKCRLTNTRESWHIVTCSSGWQKKIVSVDRKSLVICSSGWQKNIVSVDRKPLVLCSSGWQKKILSVDRKPPIFSADKKRPGFFVCCCLLIKSLRFSLILSLN